MLKRGDISKFSLKVNAEKKNPIRRKSDLKTFIVKEKPTQVRLRSQHAQTPLQLAPKATVVKMWHPLPDVHQRPSIGRCAAAASSFLSFCFSAYI